MLARLRPAHQAIGADDVAALKITNEQVITEGIEFIDVQAVGIGSP